MASMTISIVASLGFGGCDEKRLKRPFVAPHTSFCHYVRVIHQDCIADDLLDREADTVR